MLSPVASYKSRLCQAFSKHASTYDIHAGIQAYAAECCADIAATVKTRSAVPDGDILEIGCGTGLFSQKLLNVFPDKRIIFSDLSAGMVEACRLRLTSQKESNLHNFDFAILDAEELNHENKYSVIASSFTIQWFYQPAEGLLRLLSALKPGGLLIFSTPGEDSCPEWKAAAGKAEVPFTRNPLLSMEELQRFAVANQTEFLLQDHFVQEQHPDAKTMLRTIKELGAGTQRNNLQLTCMQLRKLLRELDEGTKALHTTYQVITGYIRRTK